MNPVFALQNINSWWQTGEVDHSYLHKRIRSEFTDILKGLEDNRITSIVGPSGVGKTALLYQTINHLLRKELPPQRIVYFSGDEMTLFGEHRSIGSLLESYATDILHENLFTLKTPVYILIDDIQFIDDWQIYLLNYRQKAANIKFIIAATFSPNNTLPSDAESHIPVLPLTQQQFAEFYGAYRQLDIDFLRFKSLLPAPSIFEDPAEYYVELSANVYALNEYKPYKARIVEEYLFGGGYPAYFGTHSSAEWQTNLLDHIDRALYRDIGAAYNLKAPSKLKRLLYLIAEQGTREQSFGNIGHALYVDTSTIINYISALSDGGLAGFSENYSPTSGQEGRVVRKNKRLYVFDNGVCNALLHITNISADYGAQMSSASVYMARRFAKEKGGTVFFWKDGRRSSDIVLSRGGSILPVTVCTVREQDELAAKGLRAFMRLYGARKAVVITKDVLRSEDGVFFIPYWMI